MKFLSVLFLICGAALAQIPSPTPSISIMVDPNNITPGGSTSLYVAFADASPSANVAGIQFALTLPSGVTIAGPGSIGAGAATDAIANNPATNAYLIAGIGSPLGAGATPAETAGTLSRAPFTSGTILTIPVTVASTISGITGGVSGPITLTGLVASNQSGIAVPFAAAASTTISIACSKYAITGDCTASVADVDAAVSQALGLTPCTAGDVNGDGVCNIQDVILVLQAAGAH